MADGGRWRRGGAPTLAVAALVLVGVALRLRLFLDARALWLDEAMLALNVAVRSYTELLRPLAWTQSAPPLYLWLERAAVEAFGVGEQPLRVVALVAGVLLLPLLWLVARALLGRAGALVALAVAALSPQLVRYANEVKPYSSDACVTLVLLALALVVLRRPADRWGWVTLVVVGAVTIYLSTTAVFVLAGVGAALVASADVRRSPRAVGWLAGAAAVWGAAFVALYVGVLRAVATHETMRLFFLDAFLDPRSPHFREFATNALRGWLPGPFVNGDVMHPPYTTPTVALLLAVGVVAIARQRGLWAVCLTCVPLLAALVASAVGQYPVVMRTMTFGAPLLIVLATAGLAAIATGLAARLLEPWRRAVAPVAAAAILVPAAAWSVATARAPWRYEDVRPAAARLARPDAAGIPLYIGWGAGPVWAFYTTDWSAPDTARLAWLAAREDWLPVPGVLAPGGAVVPDTTAPVARRPVAVYAGRREILSQPRYIDRPAPGSRRVVTTVPGWPEREVALIRQEARPDVFVLHIRHADDPAPLVLRAALRSAGAEVVETIADRSTVLDRVRFRAAVER
jgi:4-amino-4-deoxy-L-arabinose transferase-like glycosyltransferase